MDSLTKILESVAQAIEVDTNLETEQKEEILSLIAEINLDPKPQNLEVLGIILNKLGDYTEQINSLEKLVQSV
jgi:hypothetical protein